MDNQQFLIAFGANLKKRRQEKNLSLSKLAADCGYEKSNMSRMESGKANPTLLTMRKICKALDISVKELFVFPENEQAQVTSQAITRNQEI